MKQLGLSLLLLVVIVGIAFVLLDASLLDEDFAGSVYEKGIPLAIASFALLALPYAHQAISGRRSRFSFTSLPDKVVRFDDYLLPWYILLLYGTLFLYAVSGLAIFLIWLAGEVTGFYFTRLISGLNFIFLMAATFVVGSWIGTRARQRPFLLSSGVILAYALLVVLTTLLIHSSFYLISLLLATVPYLLVILVGTWLGQRKRVVSYVRYLLTFVPAQKGMSIADAICQEVLALSPVDVQSFPRFFNSLHHTTNQPPP